MAKILKLKDLIKESLWDTRKFGDPLPTVEDYKKAYNKKHNITEAEPPKKQPPPGGGAPPGDEDTSKEMKIDIPNSPFAPDINQVTNKLKQILKTWATNEYPNDRVRWNDYFHDIEKLVKQIEEHTDDV